ncbi:MAG: ComF family protein [Leptolyngbya sp. SIO4C1]|nr:ComF family protein [Leptolyngbya sp. SIO4C1]
MPDHMLDRLLSGFLKPSCLLCQRPAIAAFCLDCTRQLHSCQSTSTCEPLPAQLRLWSWGHYQGPLKRALHQLKYQTCPQIAEPLGLYLAQCWQQSVGQPAANGSIVVVPIPLHAERLQQRGYNQAALIAQSFCRLTGLTYLPQGLQRVRTTVAQHQLGSTQRQQNLHSAFRLGTGWSPSRRQRPVLLIDDIYTTGTTIQAAATELRQGGLQVVGAAVVARATLAKTAPKPPAKKKTVLS